MENEVWKDIEGYEGIYQVSSHGRVRSLDRTITKPHPRNGAPSAYFHRGRIIKQHEQKGGYLFVSLKDRPRKQIVNTHRLVAKAFVPGYFEGADVNHKDCNRKNNRADNLEWVTRRENLKYAYGDRASAIEQIHRSQRKPVIQMTMDGEFIKEWPSIYAAVVALHLDSKSIGGCCKGRYGTKSCGGFKWKFRDTGKPMHEKQPNDKE